MAYIAEVVSFSFWRYSNVDVVSCYCVSFTLCLCLEPGKMLSVSFQWWILSCSALWKTLRRPQRLLLFILRMLMLKMLQVSGCPLIILYTSAYLCKYRVLYARRGILTLMWIKLHLETIMINLILKCDWGSQVCISKIAKFRVHYISV